MLLHCALKNGKFDTMYVSPQFKNLFIYLIGKEGGGRERKRERIFYMLVHSPNAYNCWGCARLNRGTRNSVQLLHIGG